VTVTIWPRIFLLQKFVVQCLCYRALHGDAPQYLRQFTPIADNLFRQRLQSFSSDDLLVPAVRLPSIGRRAFFVAEARIWNDLPTDVTSAPCLLIFRKRLKLDVLTGPVL